MMVEDEFVTIDLAEPCDVCHQATGVPLQSCDQCKQPLSGFRTLPFRKVSTPAHLGLMGHKECFRRAHHQGSSSHVTKGSRIEPAVGSSSTPDIMSVCDTSTSNSPMLQAFTDIMTRSVNSLFSKSPGNDQMSASFHEVSSDVSRRYSETSKNNKSKRVSRDYSDATMRGHDVITKRRGNARRSHDNECSAKRTAKKRPDETSSSTESEDNCRLPVYSCSSVSKMPLLAKAHDKPKHRRNKSYSVTSTRLTPLAVSPDGTSTSESDSIELCVGKMKTFQSHKRSKSSPIVRLTKENLAVMQQQAAINAKYPNIKTPRCLASGMPDIIRCSNITSESSSSPDSSRMSSDEVGKPKSARSIVEETFKSDSDMSPDFIVEQNMVFIEDVTPDSENDVTALLGTCRNRRNISGICTASGKDSTRSSRSTKSKSCPPVINSPSEDCVDGRVDCMNLPNAHCSARTMPPARHCAGGTNCQPIPVAAPLPAPSLPKPPAQTVTQVSPLGQSTSALSCLFPICGDTATLSQAFRGTETQAFQIETQVQSPKTRPYSNIYEQSSNTACEDEDEMGIFSYNSRSRKKWLRSHPRCKSESYLNCPLTDNHNIRNDIHQFCSQAEFHAIMDKSFGYTSPKNDIVSKEPDCTRSSDNHVTSDSTRSHDDHVTHNYLNQNHCREDLPQSNGNPGSWTICSSGGGVENQDGCEPSIEDPGSVSGSLSKPIRPGAGVEIESVGCDQAAECRCGESPSIALTYEDAGWSNHAAPPNTIVKCKSYLGDHLAGPLSGAGPVDPGPACCHRRVPCGAGGCCAGASQSGPAAGGGEFRGQQATTVSWDIPPIDGEPPAHCRPDIAGQSGGTVELGSPTSSEISMMELSNKSSPPAGGGKISPDRIRPHVARRRPISMYASRHVAYPHWDTLADQYTRSKVMLLSRTWYECSQDFLMSRKACRTGYETNGINHCRPTGEEGVAANNCKLPLKELNFSGIHSEVTTRAKTLMDICSDHHQKGHCNFVDADDNNFESADDLSNEWHQTVCGSQSDANLSPDYNYNKTSNCSKYVASTRIKMRRSGRPKSIGDFSLLRTKWDYSANAPETVQLATSKPVSNYSSLSGSNSWQDHSLDSLPSNLDTDKVTAMNCVIQNCQTVPKSSSEQSLSQCTHPLQTMDTDEPPQTRTGGNNLPVPPPPSQSQCLWDEFSSRHSSSSADGLGSPRVEVDGDILDGPLPPVELENGCLKAEDGVDAVAIETTANGLVLTEALKYTRDKLLHRCKEDIMVLVDQFYRQIQTVSEELVELLQVRHELYEQVEMRQIAIEQLLRSRQLEAPPGVDYPALQVPLVVPDGKHHQESR